MVNIKNEREMLVMQEGGKILASLLDKDIFEVLHIGNNALNIDSFCEKYIQAKGAIPVLKGYQVNGLKFPNTICFSINDEVVHGLPTRNKVIKDGDIFSIDISIKWKNFYLDAARTYFLGKVPDKVKKFINQVKSSLDLAISNAIVGNRIGDISSAIQKSSESNGYSVVKEFCGHGIGRSLHEEPMVPNFGAGSLGYILESGLVLAIEPMINLGKDSIYITNDNWTVKTLDKSLSCHFEDTIAITSKGPKILTRISEEDNVS